jgi:hypothetical protein
LSIGDVVITTLAKKALRSVACWAACGLGDYIVSKFSHITGILIPFFKENPILGVKALDFQD